MKKIIGTIFTIFTIFILSGCGTSIHEDLQANDWNMVQSDGQTGIAEFSTNTATFTNSMFGIASGYQYELNEEETEITLTQDNEEQVYSVAQENEEITFTGQEDDEVFTIVLTPIEEE